jgi:hypothetical protein
VKQSKKMNAALLQLALLALLCVATPAGAQTNESTTTSTTTSQSNSDPIPTGSEFKDKPNPYNGMGEGVPVRKDAWAWYWNEKAQVVIDPQDKAGFWGNDAISNFFRNISNSFFIPFWNGAMEYDFIRAGLLLVFAGMLLGLGATMVMPKKPEAK